MTPPPTVSPSQPQPPQFILWQEVELHGLSADALNGRRARIDSWKGKKARFAVQLLDSSGAAEKTIAVRPRNLKAVPWLDAREKEDCPVCMEPMAMGMTTTVNACCGQSMCVACSKKCMASEAANRIKCPMCRTPNATTDEENVTRLRTHVANGKAWAQCQLAGCYDHGSHGLEQSHAKAAELLTKAAKQGHGKAQYLLGSCYRHGDGVEKDMGEAVHLWKLAAAQGYADAQLQLGNCYHNGDGVEKDMKEAARLWKLAAEQGHANAQNNLGFCYVNGEGVEKDVKNAVRMYKLAAEQGYANAQYNLGKRYLTGEGVEMDMKEGVRLCKLAAEQGNAYAQFCAAAFASAASR